MQKEKSLVAKAVRELRQALGVSQEAFARRMGITLRTVARWETTRPPKSIETLLELAALAGDIGLDELKNLFSAASLAKIRVGTPLRQILDADHKWEFTEEERTRIRGWGEDHAALSEILGAPEKYPDELAAWRLIRREIERRCEEDEENESERSTEA